MSIEPQSSSPSRSVENEIQQDRSNFDESTALIRKASSNNDADEEVGEVSKSWYPQSLGSGFIWIETGASLIFP